MVAQAEDNWRNKFTSLGSEECVFVYWEFRISIKTPKLHHGSQIHVKFIKIIWLSIKKKQFLVYIDLLLVHTQ